MRRRRAELEEGRGGPLPASTPLHPARLGFSAYSCSFADAEAGRPARAEGGGHGGGGRMASSSGVEEPLLFPGAAPSSPSPSPPSSLPAHKQRPAGGALPPDGRASPSPSPPFSLPAHKQRPAGGALPPGGRASPREPGGARHGPWHGGLELSSSSSRRGPPLSLSAGLLTGGSTSNGRGKLGPLPSPAVGSSSCSAPLSGAMEERRAQIRRPWRRNGGGARSGSASVESRRPAELAEKIRSALPLSARRGGDPAEEQASSAGGRVELGRRTASLRSGEPHLLPRARRRWPATSLSPPLLPRVDPAACGGRLPARRRSWPTTLSSPVSSVPSSASASASLRAGQQRPTWAPRHVRR
ncbi:unnamed protein product [Urochloa humidicola]